MKYKYSETENSFYPSEINYEKLPKDAIDISESDYQKALKAREENRPFDFKKGILTIYDQQPDQFHFFDKKNKTWVLDEEKKNEFLLRLNSSKLADLLREATEQINILQDAVNFDIATKEEKEQLPELQKYRILLNRVKLSTNEVIFPEKPSFS